MTRRPSTFPLLVCMLFLAGCPYSCIPYEPKEYLAVTVLADPVGGQNLSTVSTSWKADYTFHYPPEAEGAPDVKPVKGIDLKVKYTNDNGGTYAEQTVHFTHDAAGGTPTTLTFSAPAGLFLDKTFWGVFTWVDSQGAHEVNSGKAAFTVR